MLLNQQQWRSFTPVSSDISSFFDNYGILLFPVKPMHTFVVWALDSGLMQALLTSPGTAESIADKTSLTVPATKGILGILCATGVATINVQTDVYSATQQTKDYFDREGQYYVGDQILAQTDPIPKRYLKEYGDGSGTTDLKVALGKMNFGTIDRLINQQQRNLPAAISAVHSGLFDKQLNVLDLAGGSGVFSIPLVLRNPNIKVILAEVTESLANIQKFVDAAEVSSNITLKPVDARGKWDLGTFDTIYISAYLHSVNDDECIKICQQAYDSLEEHGKIFIHEALWNDDKLGPVNVALLNEAMVVHLGGKQRTLAEFTNMLLSTGFSDITSVSTKNGMTLLSATK